MRSTSVLLLAVLALYAVCAHAQSGLYNFKTDNVIEISEKSFPLSTNQLWMIEFYAPWCGHCQKLKPDWIKLAQSTKGLINVGAVNCDEESNKPLCGRFQIQGFPTIKVFNKGAPQDYNGERSAKAMYDYAVSAMPSAVKRVSDKDEPVFLNNQNALPHVLLFTEKTSTSPLYKALSTSFSGKLVFGEVQRANKALTSKYGVGTFPALFVVPSAGATPVQYDGAFQMRALKSFLRTFLPVSEQQDDDSLPEIKDQSCFEKYCSAPGGLCALLVTPAYGSSSQQDRKYAELLKQVEEDRADSHFHYSWLNGSRSDISEWVQSALELEPSDSPRLLVLAPRKTRAALHVGSFSFQNAKEFLGSVLNGATKTFPLRGSIPSLPTTTQACPRAASSSSSSSSSKSSSSSSSSSSAVNYNAAIDEKSFEKTVLQSPSAWMIKLVAPWCGHCRNLAPEWQKAANSLKGLVKFGDVDCESDAGRPLCNRFGVKGYPTIKYFAATKPGVAKRFSDAQDYQYGRTSADLVRFANTILPSGSVTIIKSDKDFVPVLASIKPRVMLFTNKQSTPTLFSALSHEFSGVVDFFELRADQKYAWDAFKISAGPSLVKATGPLVNAAGEPIAGGAERYAGQLEFALIADWIKSSLNASVVSSSVPALEKQSDLRHFCLDLPGGLCIIISSDKPDMHIETANRLSARFSDKPFHFMTLNSAKQSKFAQELIGGNGVAALSPKKQRIAVHNGALDENSIAKFLNDVVTGAIKTNVISPIPTMEDIVQAASSSGPSCSSSASSSSSSSEGKCTGPKKDEL